MSLDVMLGKCILCPRKCLVDRTAGGKGYCQVPGTEILLSRAALHFWEEPCISGTKGSGAVFFSGCNLRCVYCQNAEISNGKVGLPVTVSRLAEIFLELQEKGALNINLVTPTPYAPMIRTAVIEARENGLTIPTVYNTSGYESPEVLKEMADVIDIYLTDFKYMEKDLAKSLSGAEDYPERAKDALAQMVSAQGTPEFTDDGIMKRGIIVRHLLLPGHVKNAKAVVDYVYDTYGDRVYLSLMNQYTPLKAVEQDPLLHRTVTRREYERLISYTLEKGVKNAFIQEGATRSESFIPAFDFEGVLRKD